MRLLPESQPPTPPSTVKPTPLPLVRMGSGSAYGSDCFCLAAEQCLQRQEKAPRVLHEELKHYLRDDLDPSGGDDMLKWWKVSLSFFHYIPAVLICYLQQDHTSIYPILSKIACDYLTIQGSSVPCKCLFSAAGLVNTNRCNRLTPTTFSTIQTIKNHLRMKK